MTGIKIQDASIFEAVHGSAPDIAGAYRAIRIVCILNKRLGQQARALLILLRCFFRH